MAKIQSANTNNYSYSLLPKSDYEGRLVSMVFIGVQPQQPYLGKAKPDVLVAKCAFELIGETVTKTDKDGNEEQMPAVIYWDVNIPSAGVTRGKAFDLIQATVGGGETYDDTEKYKALIGCPVSVKVGSYTSKHDGRDRNCCDGILAIPSKYREGIEDATVPTKFFCCYSDTPEMKEVFTTLGKFTQEKILNASDKQYIPASTGDWPTQAVDASTEKDEF